MLYGKVHLTNLHDLEYNRFRLLFFEDITTDPGDWKNVGMSEYYGKSSIVIAADESLE